MPTINQLIATPRKPLKARNTAPALENSPQKRSVHARLHHDAEEAELGVA